MKQRIKGTITRPNGEEVQFLLSGDGAMQWGASPRELGETQPVLEAMNTAVRHGTDFFAEPEPEDEGEDVTVRMEAIRDFTTAITEASKAAAGDSNDEEIEALWNAIDEACAALGLNRDDFVQ